MKRKVGVFGHFAFGRNKRNGQTIKTLSVAHILKQEFGEENVLLIDTFEKFSLCKNAYLLQKECKHKVLMTAQNGIRILVPLMYALNGFSGKQLHFVVIGGWLVEFLQKRKMLCEMLKHFDGVYAETESMVKGLSDMGFENVFLMPNFKPFEEKVSTIKSDISSPVKLCTFSRVMQEKGIEEAIKGVKLANESGTLGYHLTVFGAIEQSFKEKFLQLQKEYADVFSYGGEIAFDESVKTIKIFDALLFPTYYEGEGMAGTLIDAFKAGLPVVATDFKYNKDYVLHGENGLLIKPADADAVKEAVLELFEKADVLKFRENSLCMAERFESQCAARRLLENLK